MLSGRGDNILNLEVFPNLHLWLCVNLCISVLDEAKDRRPSFGEIPYDGRFVIQELSEDVDMW